MSRNAPDAVAGKMTNKIMKALALWSLDGSTMCATDYCEIINSKSIAKFFLPENTQIWYRMALVTLLWREHHLCKTDHEQLQANNVGF